MINLLDDRQIADAKSGCTSELSLTFHGLEIRVKADNDDILSILRPYFSGLTGNAKASALQQVFLLDRQWHSDGIEWTPVRRAKVSPLGLKEAYVDVPHGRWIHKVRTGMVMFQSLTDPIAIGELGKNQSQVINFINNQFLNYHQRQGYLLGHASAFTIDGCATAIAASSGGGKSTLMLKVLETEKARFLSNDRILFKPAGGQVHILGLAKHPRVNPGTLINSERLASILPAEERSRFEGLPRHQLWEIEQKYDVPIPRMYGENKTSLSGNLKNLVLLDWSLDSPEPTHLAKVDIEAAPEALQGLRKSPGPFFQQSDGRFPPEQSQALEVYAENLEGVQVWNLTGRIDFDRAIEHFQEQGIL